MKLAGADGNTMISVRESERSDLPVLCASWQERPSVAWETSFAVQVLLPSLLLFSRYGQYESSPSSLVAMNERKWAFDDIPDPRPAFLSYHTLFGGKIPLLWFETGSCGKMNFVGTN